MKPVKRIEKSIETLISNKTRIKLLVRFFLNPESTSYLRKLEEEFDESTNAIRVELNRFEQAGLLTSFTETNKKVFRANENHPMYREINSLVKKYLGLDQIVEHLANKVGNLRKAYLTGNIAMGLPGESIEVILIGDDFKTDKIDDLTKKAEEFIKRKVVYTLVETPHSASALKKCCNYLLIWEKTKNN